jgi:Gelsolin repeat.
MIHQLSGSDKATSDIRVLFKVSDASGKLVFEKIAEGHAIKRTMISSNDAFILQSGFEIYVWVGLKASESERKNAFLFAQQYVRDNKLFVISFYFYFFE